MRSTGYILLLGILAAPCPAAHAQPPAVPAGLYCTTNTCNWVLKDGKRVDLFTYPIDGVLNYVAWRSIEPKRGEYRFPGLDRMTREAAAQDKKLAYHILAGMHAPDWLFEEAGVKPLAVTRRGKPRRMYLPWVEDAAGKRALNAAFLAAWRQTVHAFAKHLRRPPCRDRIWYVAMTGWPESNGLELMMASDSFDEFKKLRWDDGGEELYVEFCERIIDIWLDAMPDFPLGIAFTDWYGRLPNGAPRRDIRTSEKIVSYAVAEGNRRGATVIPMGLWIGGAGIISKPNHPLVRLMKQLKQSAPGIALEGPMGSYNGYAPLRDQLTFARDIGASWVQLWHHDVIYPPYQPLLREFRGVLGPRP